MNAWICDDFLKHLALVIENTTRCLFYGNDMHILGLPIIESNFLILQTRSVHVPENGEFDKARNPTYPSSNARRKFVDLYFVFGAMMEKK